MKYVRITIAVDRNTAIVLKRVKEINDMSYNELLKKLLQYEIENARASQKKEYKERNIVDLFMGD